MKLLLEPTEKLVTVVINGHDTPCRIWQGETVDGAIPVHCYILSVAVAEGRPAADYEQFERALKEQTKMRPDIAAIPLRLII